MKTKRYVYEREIYKQEARQLYQNKNSYVSCIYVQTSVFEISENTDFVFFAYLKKKLNTAGSFRVFTLHY